MVLWTKVTFFQNIQAELAMTNAFLCEAQLAIHVTKIHMRDNLFLEIVVPQGKCKHKFMTILGFVEVT